MPNFNNFQSDIADLNERYTKFTVSRVFAEKSSDLLEMEVPAEFSTVKLNNNVEINLYSLADNSLIFSDVINNPEAFHTETLQYTDGTSRTLLYINFAKQPELLLPDGQYSVTLNFLSDELGSYDDRILKISRISTSRTEVELKLIDMSQQTRLEQIAVPRINKEYIYPALRQIFNQEGADELVIPASSVKIDSTNVYTNFASGSGERLIQYGFDQDNGTQLGINTITQNVLNDAFNIAWAQTNIAISRFNSGSLTETELSTIVINALDEAYDAALNDEQNNPQNYRFDLV